MLPKDEIVFKQTGVELTNSNTTRTLHIVGVEFTQTTQIGEMGNKLCKPALGVKNFLSRKSICKIHIFYFFYENYFLPCNYPIITNFVLFTQFYQVKFSSVLLILSFNLFFPLSCLITHSPLYLYTTKQFQSANTVMDSRYVAHQFVIKFISMISCNINIDFL